MTVCVFVCVCVLFSQYVVQPYSIAGNMLRFNINAANTTHRMRW